MRPEAFEPLHWGKITRCLVSLRQVPAPELEKLVREAWLHASPPVRAGRRKALAPKRNKSAPEQASRDLARIGLHSRQGGFTKFRRATETPFNIILERDVGTLYTASFCGMATAGPSPVSLIGTPCCSMSVFACA